MSEAGRVLIVDDELPIRRLLRSTLSVHGYAVAEAATLREARVELVSAMPDVLLLDLGLPDGDGFELIDELRQASSLPIIVLSARGDDAGKVLALDSGADDYVTKPFSVEELMARIRNALRHRVQSQGATPLFTCGDLSVDLVRRIVRRHEADIKLSPKEYGILQQLVIHAGKVLTHKHLLTAVWGASNIDDVAYLRVYIRQLRSKLEIDPERPALIVTEPGVGYRFRYG